MRISTKINQITSPSFKNAVRSGGTFTSSLVIYSISNGSVANLDCLPVGNKQGSVSEVCSHRSQWKCDPLTQQWRGHKVFPRAPSRFQNKPSKKPKKERKPSKTKCPAHSKSVSEALSATHNVGPETSKFPVWTEVAV